MTRTRLPLWPRSLQGQMLLAIALALLVAQGLSAALIWRAQHERREAALVNTAAFRLVGGSRGDVPPPRRPARPIRPDDEGARGPRVLVEDRSPQLPGEVRNVDAERAIAEQLADQGIRVSEIVVVERDPFRDQLARRWMARHHRFDHAEAPPRLRMLIAAVRRDDGTWLSARVLAPDGERALIASIALQTVVLYIVLVGAVALILRRIARPLKALTARVEEFARARTVDGQLEPEGPDDVQRLIVAHNAMEGRIAALLDEKDVMLGAIGHDLKTPLAALRVRIEAVDDDAERARMASVIDDINHSLDDILSLARVGRPSDPLEPTELSALVAAVVEEYEDMGEPVDLGDTVRIVMPLRATWLRRALRNLVSNAVRYGQRARVSLAREGREAVLRIEDDGPGIPDGEIARMMEPFTRLEPSRNTGTGGSGLGLTLARAIAEQHGGSLVLANRRSPEGAIAGLVATLRLPLV
jgi:signal transduction histidine kinase